ncbi:MAG: T9SS type A sorting domain-containing protein [Candidatus Cloacimonadaceae bacterium]|jgi:hypothetical protein|nr:T9SS type A sorting domain-containing protein [Candidatus Cloacimonadota bacterium]MDY0111642.1 T9SS type A sorting domain-containing protein [Candidatus Syntrophosphaera sp.]
MRFLITITVLLFVSFSFALDFVPGSGSQVISEDCKEYSFGYHQGTDDYHFYGSDKWAVFFDFASVYPAAEISQFITSKALIYLPQTGDSIRVELFSNEFNHPGTLLTWNKVPVSSNWIEVTFPQTVQESSLWLVVTYSTSFTGIYVSASQGGGEHSYYSNTNVPQAPYYQSFASAGFNAELLFGLAGEFVLDSQIIDLELTNFDLEGIIEPGQTVAPTFAIYNHSGIPITDATINLNVYSPDPDFAFFDEIPIPETIAPLSLYEFNNQNPAFFEHQFVLPERPLQLKLRAALVSSHNDNDPQANNVRLIHRFSFADSYPIFLIENFLRWQNVSQITWSQDQYSFPQFHILNYFPILGDTLSSIAAQNRFNWYHFNSLPRTVVNGDLRINGFSTNYGDQFVQLCTQAQNYKTFISSADFSIINEDHTDQLYATLTLNNAHTQLYSSVVEYDIVNSSRLFVGLFKKQTFNEGERWVIDRWIVQNQPLNGSLNADQSLTINFFIPLNNISLSELEQFYRIYYWLQLQDSGKILYSSYSEFSNFVAVQDENNFVPRLIIFPNPLHPGELMKVSINNGKQIGRVQIYNLRGQKIKDFYTSQSEITITADQFPVNGIYFLRFPSIPSAKTGMPTIHKIIILK